jgi:RimJ/RimL family protein N-acetyltransferase
MIAPENLASVRLAERVGYRPYATTTYKDSPVQLFERPKQA